MSKATLMAVLVLMTSAVTASAAPVIFWASDDVGPGAAVLAYGGPLEEATGVRAWRLADGDPGRPGGGGALSAPRGALETPALQPRPESVKFLLPERLSPGVFAFQVRTPQGDSVPHLLNVPRPRFAQPMELRPGLAANEAYPGARLQVIGVNFAAGREGGRFRVALVRAGARPLVLQPESLEKYSCEVELPGDLMVGEYELWLHHGSGGAAAWGGPLKLTVKRPEVWPERVFNVKDFGAVGDDVHDDTEAVQAALGAAEQNGGGIVYFPWGTYRISDWIFIPERTVVRGEDRETTWLKWPQNHPEKPEAVLKAAVYAAGSYAVEDLSLMVRNAEFCLRDLSFDSLHRRLYNFPAPQPELASSMKPWGQQRDVFLRRVRIQHLYLCARPEPEFYGYYNRQSMLTLAVGGIRNFQVKDCDFLGIQRMLNVDNARIEDSSFGNQLGPSWTDLAGRHVVFQGNEIRGASSWRWSGIPLEYLYSAHNVSYNVERGEREAMTFDVNGLPGGLNGSYWGSPVEVGNEEGNVFLRFPPAGEVSLDGAESGFSPGHFRGGDAVIHAYEGGPGRGQVRKILDNTEDTVFLEKPWDTPPDTEARKGYIEVRSPRRGHWAGALTGAEGTRLRAAGADWIPGLFRGMKVLITEGPGAGQYREVTSNTEDTLTVESSWAVQPQAGSMILVFQLMRHAIVWNCEGFDTSAFSQLWGNFYDLIIDGCRVRRGQGIWALSGWFVQMRDNDLAVAMSYHPGIGPGGINPEGCTPFAPVGFMTAGRLFDAQPPTPAVRGAVLRGNRLDYNHRLVLQSSYSFQETRDRGRTVFADVVMDRNEVARSAVGIQAALNLEGVLLSGNRFREVETPYLLAAPEQVLIVEEGPTG